MSFTFWTDLQLYRVEVSLELNGENARLLVSPPSLSPSHPPPSPPKPMASSHHFTPALAKFQLVWCRLCEALLSSSSLAGQKHPSLLSRLV